jgi:hypothetical protein
MTNRPKVPIAIGARPPNCQAPLLGGRPVSAPLKIPITPNRKRGFTTYPTPTSCVIAKRAGDTNSESRGPSGPANVTRGTANNVRHEGATARTRQLGSFSRRSVGVSFESSARQSVRCVGPDRLPHRSTRHRDRTHGVQCGPCCRSQWPRPDGLHEPNDSPRLPPGSAT